MIELRRARARVDEARVRYSVAVSGLPCAARTVEAALRQAELVRMIADQPEAFACGPYRWDRLEVAHDGARWTAAASATVEERDGAGG